MKDILTVQQEYRDAADLSDEFLKRMPPDVAKNMDADKVDICLDKIWHLFGESVDDMTSVESIAFALFIHRHLSTQMAYWVCDLEKFKPKLSGSNVVDLFKDRS